MARFNLEGFEFSKWINKSKLKDIVKFVLPVATIWITTGSWWMTGVGAIIGKPILDLAHYYISK